MKQLLKLFLILVCIPKMSFSQGNVKQSLYVVHVDASGKSQFRQRIFAYHFLNGSFTGRDEVLSFEGRREGKDYIRTDRGTNTIYDNRYLITAIGNIIDLKDKKVLFDGKAGLIRCSNDSAIYYTNDVFKGKFYSVYDFKKKQYGEVKDLLFKPKFGRDVEFDKTASPFKINYYPQGKPKVILSMDAGYGQTGTKDNSFVPDPPMYWIDDATFIFLYFNKENTEIVVTKMNVDTKTTEVIAKMAITKESNPAVLTKVDKDQLILRIGNKQALLDLKAGTLVQMDQSRPDKGFSYEFKSDSKGRVVKLNGKEVGKFHFETKNFCAGDNIAAFVKELMIGADSYQQGLMVWNFSKQAWESVEADEVLTIAGWAKD